MNIDRVTANSSASSMLDLDDDVELDDILQSVIDFDMTPPLSSSAGNGGSMSVGGSGPSSLSGGSVGLANPSLSNLLINVPSANRRPTDPSELSLSGLSTPDSVQSSSDSFNLNLFNADKQKAISEIRQQLMLTAEQMSGGGGNNGQSKGPPGGMQFGGPQSGPQTPQSPMFGGGGGGNGPLGPPPNYQSSMGGGQQQQPGPPPSYPSNFNNQVINRFIVWL